MTLLKTAVFVEAGRIVVDDQPILDGGPQDALMRAEGRDRVMKHSPQTS